MDYYFDDDGYCWGYVSRYREYIKFISFEEYVEYLK